MKNKKLTTYQMAVTALMAAAMCVLGPLTVPIGAIPISLANFVICLTAWLLGPKFGTLSVAVYLLTPVIIENSTTAALVAGEIALGGTFVHHYIDSAITAPILLALSRAGLVKKPYFVK